MKTRYEFFAFGHENILATHNKTLEFIKDENLTLRGDCIVGVNSDFDKKELTHFIKKAIGKKIKILIDTIPENKKLHEEITADLNQDFSDPHELVVRQSSFISERTFAINSSKSSLELNRELIGFLKNCKNKIKITIKEF